MSHVTCHSHMSHALVNQWSRPAAAARTLGALLTNFPPEVPAKLRRPLYKQYVYVPCETRDIVWRKTFEESHRKMGAAAAGLAGRLGTRPPSRGSPRFFSHQRSLVFHGGIHLSMPLRSPERWIDHPVFADVAAGIRTRCGREVKREVNRAEARWEQSSKKKSTQRRGAAPARAWRGTLT